MLIGRVERRIGAPMQNHVQRVTRVISNGNTIQKTEGIENNVVRFKEIIFKGWNKFVKAQASYDKDGKYIKNSRFITRIDGPEANKKQIPFFDMNI